ncbi:MAG: sigma-70 family RNA polymerase sigma factor [Anaerolineae bacterium]|nr:sigma-70 family RNA polymerase sigma factor [Anaerolineae bacterium]
MDRGDERKWIKEARRGDVEAFAALYREHVQAIFRFVYHRVNDRAQAEDITGDVFVRALEALPNYQPTEAPFLAWLYSIARARVIDFYRQQGRRPAESDVDEQPVPVEMDLDAPLMQQQLVADLRKAVANLTPEQQQVIHLRFVEGLRLEEVATRLGKNANAIKALQHRALRALAARLERSNFDLESTLAGLSS